MSNEVFEVLNEIDLGEVAGGWGSIEPDSPPPTP
jgi:hypothetical protein